MVCTTRYCRSESLQLLKEQLPVLDTTEGLFRGAVAIAAHSFDDIDLLGIDSYLQSLAERVIGEGRSSCPRSSCPRARLARLHMVLFEEEGYRGNQQRYYHPLNSFLPAVIASRRGLPITLSLIYKVVGDRAGLSIEGVNSPGHFLVRVRDDIRGDAQGDVRSDGGAMLIDPFHGGKVVNQQEAFSLFDSALGKRLPRGEYALRTATHRQWLQRLVGNLQQIFATAGCWGDLAAMNELQGVLAARTD